MFSVFISATAEPLAKLRRLDVFADFGSMQGATRNRSCEANTC
jgi:hypothetical protein